MSDLWWTLLKAPLYDRVDKNRQLLEYLRSAGQEPEPTRLRQTNMGEEQSRIKKPVNVVGQEVGYSLPRLNNPDLTGSPFANKNFNFEYRNKNFTHFYESPDKKVRAGIKHLGDNKYAVDHYGVREDLQEQGIGREGLMQLRRELEAHHGGPVEMTPSSVIPSSQGFWDKMQSENITNMLKEAKSPAALEHKRKYETEYESSPARKKYRRELGAERRKRGVAGKGGGDMSHTKTGKIVVEDPHTNRARSHPSVGSTLKMVVVKAPQMNLMGNSAECELCGAGVDAQTAQMMNQQFGATVCMACIQREQEQINQQNDMMYHGAPMDISMRLLKEQKKLFVQGQRTLDGRPAFTPTDFAAEEQRRQAALKEQQARERREAQRLKAAEGNATLPQFQQNPE